MPTPDHNRRSLMTGVSLGLDWLRKNINTSMPGVVKAFDPARSMAVVQPAIKVRLQDDTERELPDILDVPVVYPAGGGYAITFPVRVGDPVLMLFSQRGLTEWKRTLDVASADRGVFHSMGDAVAIPGFGADVDADAMTIRVPDDGELRINGDALDAVIQSYTATWAHAGNTDLIPSSKIPGGGGGGGSGLTQAEVDARVDAGVEQWAHDGDATAIPASKLANAPSTPGPVGPQGPPGADGQDGAAGATGPPGPQGQQGPRGDQGLPGATGATGATGPQGEQGEMGLPGPQGATGATGATGSPGPTGPSGADGDDGAPGSDGDTGWSPSLRLFPRNNGAEQVLGLNRWIGGTGTPPDDYAEYIGPSGFESVLIAGTNVRGAVGPQGATGAEGPMGAPGPTGATGSTGPRGEQGLPGPQGDTGPRGEQGLAGPEGPQGLTGPQGPQGLPGQDGAPGSDGAQGPVGPQGPAGDTGPQGEPGEPGAAAPTRPIERVSTELHSSGAKSSNSWNLLTLSADLDPNADLSLILYEFGQDWSRVMPVNDLLRETTTYSSTPTGVNGAGIVAFTYHESYDAYLARHSAANRLWFRPESNIEGVVVVQHAFQTATATYSTPRFVTLYDPSSLVGTGGIVPVTTDWTAGLSASSWHSITLVEPLNDNMVLQIQTAQGGLENRVLGTMLAGVLRRNRVHATNPFDVMVDVYLAESGVTDPDSARAWAANMRVYDVGIIAGADNEAGGRINRGVAFARSASDEVVWVCARDSSSSNIDISALDFTPPSS